jgi:hypothetical protein
VSASNTAGDLVVVRNGAVNGELGRTAPLGVGPGAGNHGNHGKAAQPQVLKLLISDSSKFVNTVLSPPDTSPEVGCEDREWVPARIEVALTPQEAVDKAEPLNFYGRLIL